MGTGIGLTSTAATESIMGVVKPEQAGAGSAVNDATREIGGTLGVAVLGSVYASLYATPRRSPARLPIGAGCTRPTPASEPAGRLPPTSRALPGSAFGHAVTHVLHGRAARRLFRGRRRLRGRRGRRGRSPTEPPGSRARAGDYLDADRALPGHGVAEGVFKSS